MAKRKQQLADVIHATMFKMALISGAVYGAIHVLRNISIQAWIIAFVGAVALAVAYALMKRASEAQRSADIVMTVDKVWAQHKRALITQRAKLVQSDAYGQEDRQKWDKELVRFANQPHCADVVPRHTQSSGGLR